MKKNNIFDIVYYVLPFIFLILSFLTIFNNYVWSDEVFSLKMIELNYLDMIKTLCNDVHPPFYYIYLKFFSSIFNLFFNNIIISSKFVSFLSLIFTVFLGFTIVKDIYGKFTSFLFNIILISMPSILMYSIEIRMYSLCMFLIVLSYLYMIKIIKFNKNFDYFILTIITFFSLYTHYFSGVASFIIYLIILINLIKNKLNITNLILSGLLLLLLLLPWIFIQYNNLKTGVISGSYWIKPLNFKTIIDFFKYPFSMPKFHFISYLLILFVFILFVAYFGYNRFDFIDFYGILIFISLIFIGIFLSFIFKPIFTKRYVLIVLGTFWISICIISSRINKMKGIVLIVFILFGLINILERNIIEINYKNEYEKMAEFFKDKKDLVLVTDNLHIQQTMSYYLKNIKVYYYGKNDAQVSIYQKTYPKDFFNYISSIDEVNGSIVMALKSTDIKHKVNYMLKFYIDNAQDVIFFYYENKEVK